MVSRILNSFVFWGAWIAIPLVMEVIPSFLAAFTLLRKRIKGYKAPQVSHYPDISLIIPVYNCGDSLYGCIQSIHESTYDDELIRVYLVNNMTKDDSFSVYSRAQRDFPTVRMQWLNARQGKSRALNLALYNSAGKYIINIDSDGFLESHALQNMVDMFESDFDIGCMTGVVLTDPDDIRSYKKFLPRLLRQIEFMEYAQAFLAGRSYASEHNQIYTLSGAFSAFRKSTVLKTRMYNTDTIAEDTQITFQVKKLLGQKVKCCDSAIYLTGAIEGVDKLYTQRQRWQRGSLEVAKLFNDGNFTPRKILKDVNVRTLIYDHTFAFPRIIWILALICLYSMHYATRMILSSTVLIMFAYIVISYLYFISIALFLKDFPEMRKYYVSLWWIVPLLPFFNMAVFFIRFAGILNSMNTGSAWKTRTLTEEREDYKEGIKSVFSRGKGILTKMRRCFNIS